MASKLKPNTVSRFRHQLRRMIQQGAPDYGMSALPLQAAQALTERTNPSALLPYLDFEDGYVVRDNGKQPQIGFGIEFSPLMLAGKDVEDQLETMISSAPPETVIQFGALMNSAVERRVAIWKESRLRHCQNPMLAEMVETRAQHMLHAAKEHKSLIPNQRLYPREGRYFAFFTLTYTGDPEHKGEIQAWKMDCDEFRGSTQGAFHSAGLGGELLDETTARGLLRQLCNPQMVPGDLAELPNVSPSEADLARIPSIPERAFADRLFEPRTHVRVKPDGAIAFSDNERTTHVSCVTVDNYPSWLRLFMTGKLIGELNSGTDRIAAPYWLYTTIYKPDPDKAKADLTVRQGWVNKQCFSDSQWLKSMMPHLFERRNDGQRLLTQVRDKYSPVRVYTGINIMAEPGRAASDANYVSTLWSKAGFGASKERYISLPTWMASLPWGYNPAMDKSNQGLQRAQMMSSLNGATAVICQGDWGGNGPRIEKDAENRSYLEGGGLMLTSRRGQLASLDIFRSDTSYNFAVIATSGAGKSFLANEMVSDMLCRHGVVRLIDVGGSYRDLCETLGGQELRFDPSNPTSMNPFWGIKARKRHADDEAGSEIGEMMPVLKDAITEMAFPLSEPSNREYQLIEKAIWESHVAHEDRLETKHIYYWMQEFGKRSEDGDAARFIALQLEPYAVGRHAAWFNGPPKIDLSNDFTILELEELNTDLELRSVVLTLLMARITRDMYLRPRNIPKMLVIDEAWDLLGNSNAGRFIETAFRRIRKYYGAAGIITQGFQDADRSPAAKAAFDNAPWTFILKQAATSIAYARKNDTLGVGEDNDFFYDMLAGVKPGPGYSEVYVKHENGSGLFRFIVDPYSYYMYTTNPKDLTQLLALTQQGMSRQEAIRHLAAKQLEAA